jgi:hypothetical protein
MVDLLQETEVDLLTMSLHQFDLQSHFLMRELIGAKVVSNYFAFCKPKSFIICWVETSPCFRNVVAFHQESVESFNFDDYISKLIVSVLLYFDNERPILSFLSLLYQEELLVSRKDLL